MNMNFVSIRIIAHDIKAVVAFYERITNIAAHLVHGRLREAAKQKFSKSTVADA